MNAAYQCTCGDDDAQYQALVVRCLRIICAYEFDKPFNHPFFYAEYQEGEDPDAALWRLFEQERPNQDGELETIMVLIDG